MADLTQLQATEAIRIVGAGSDGSESTPIGNVGDRLKVDANISLSPGSGNTIRYEDMNASTGGVARETSITVAAGWTPIYSYTGSGKFHGFNLMLESPDSDWYIRIVLDSTIDVLMGSTGIFTTDMFGNTLYDLSPGGAFGGSSNIGITITDHNAIQLVPPANLFITFSSLLEIKVKRVNTAKKFRAGFVIRS